ncbi:hypothetical protein A1O3_08504 [Capronia epimyces CBS 606.96]|uniref:Telomerase reverse transcriptase n=1 Tax=Capronia epimyces CBS 606.96 TaxID=1182542 RepID=W9XFK9_9EURO|nr:uncharacterized protein A1O3_08504 [Capronia epimyces CBS 606.96]EXJ79003.1 hypothetical protein A1O3_08504 [Capronia epimyces CBS 606.96]
MAKKRKHQYNLSASSRPIKRQRVTDQKSSCPDDTASCNALPDIHHGVLSSLYPKLCTLRQFLLANLPSTSRVRRRKVTSFGSDDAACFFDTCLVGVLKEPSTTVNKSRKVDFATFTQSQQRATGTNTAQSQLCCMSEIIDFVIWSLFKGQAILGTRPRHILCHGLQRATVTNAHGHGGIEATLLPGIVRHHPNANLEQLKSRPWSDILSLLGEDGEVILSSLFLDCGLFTRLPSGSDNYYQLSGIPISELTPLHSSQSGCPQSAQTRSTQLSNIRFVRNRILYAKPSLNRNGKVRVGFSHAHVLQRFSDANRRDHTVHVMKYIFPRQYDLHNVFTSRVNSTETTQQFKDYTFREQEMSGQHTTSSTWVPRRLRGEAFRLIQKVQRRQNSCSYGQLFRHHCSIAASPTERPRASALKQLRQSTSSPEALSTQAPLSGSSGDILEIPSIEHETDASFIPHATPATRVSAFCRSVITKLLPSDAFGLGPEGRHNYKMIMTKMDEFIHMRRFESMTLHSVVQGIRLRPISWLAPQGKLDQKLSRSDCNKRLEILYEFVYYIFDSLLVPLIRTNFYVTESSTNRNRLFYFRHDVWRKLSGPSFAVLKSNMYIVVPPSHARRTLRSRTLGYSHLRLLPKSEGSRPITNLRRRQLRLVSGKRVLGSSINAQLGALFSILNFERARDPSPLGSALLSVGDLHGRLVQFKRMIPSGSRLYFTKVDIKSCFDSIPQEHLLNIVQCLLGEPTYRTTKYTEVKFVEDGVRDAKSRLGRRYIGAARAADDNAVFSESLASDIALKKRKVVFADTGNHRISPRRSLLQLLQEHVGNNIVKIGNNHFRQTSGIPQGSVLSSILCSYFYGAFEQSELSFLDSRSSLLLRLIDDFLLVTTDDGLARKFLDVMVRGSEKYGIIVNAEKSLANFDVSIQGRKVPRIHGSNFFPYCGLGIEMSTLELSKDREKKDAYISNALTVETCSKPGATLRRKILTSLKLQMHGMLLDMCLNNRQQVISSLLGNFTESAMKLHRYMANIPSHRRPSQGLIRNLFIDLVAVGTKLCRAKNSNNGHISKSQMYWIAASAFERVLLRKQSHYRELLGWLKSLRESTAVRMNLGPARLEQMLQENEKAFRGYVY